MAKVLIFRCEQCEQQFNLYTGLLKNNSAPWQARASEGANQFLEDIEQHNQTRECCDDECQFSFHISDMLMVD